MLFVSCLSTEEPRPETPEFECPVCLQNASFPVQLPCRHIFCFLCVKGVANRSKRCALCRQEIPAHFFHDPKLMYENEVKEKSLNSFDEGYQWFYEGRNGWWQYDERTSLELENRYKQGDKMFELLIAGFLYVIDLENMRQFRRNDQTRRRRVRRDLRSVPGNSIKGIAGLKFIEDPTVRPSGDGGEASLSNPSINGAGTNNNTDSSSNQPLTLPSHGTDGQPSVGDDTYLTPPAPNNTPQTPMTPADSQPGSLSGSQEDLSIHLQHLHINSNSSSRGSPSVDHPDQLAYRYVDQGFPTPTIEADGEFSPDDQPHFDEDSRLLNSSNSSNDSMAQAILAQEQCPTNRPEQSVVINNDDIVVHDEDDRAGDDNSVVSRQGLNAETGRYETYL